MDIKEESMGGMIKFRGVKRHTNSLSLFLFTQPAGQNRAMIVPDEAHLTLVSEVMSSSGRQQHFFITLFHSAWPSVCLSVCEAIFSHSFPSLSV